MFSAQTLQLIERYTEGSRSLELSVGARRGDETAFLSYRDNKLSFSAHPLAFEIGSITKTFVGSMLCRALDEKKIDLEDSVSRYFGDLPRDYYYPTILQLATHTAGYGEALPYSAEQRARLGDSIGADLLRVNPFRELTDADIATFVREAKLTENSYPPVYSNLGIAVLGKILADIEGATVVDMLMRFIERDLALRGFSPDRPATGYVEGRDENGEACGNWLWGGGPFTCVGGLYTTAASLLDYGDIQMSSRLPYLKRGHKAHADCFEPGAKTGLCWLIWPSDEIVWHNGGTGCFKTFFGFVESTRQSAAVLSNQKSRNGVTPEQIGASLLQST